jgi:HNH endonuclease
MKLHKYSLTQLQHAIINSSSLRQVLIKLNVTPYGGNYDVLKKAIKHFELNISHFNGQAWNKGKKLPAKYCLNDYLQNKAPIQSFKLKQRLLDQQVLEAVCVGCDNDRWLDGPIPLELDHINGDNKDNRLENLRLLCPNCHALTPTYRGRNRCVG